MTLPLRKLSSPIAQPDFAAICKLPWRGNPRAKIMVVVDPVVLTDPDAYSDGKVSSKFLNEMAPHMKAAGIKGEDCVFVSAVPPITKDTWERDSRLTAEIKANNDNFQAAYRALMPRLIISMGKAAARQVFNRAVQITKVRGVAQQDENLGCVVMPCLGVAHVMRVPEHLEVFAADLREAGRIVKNEFSYEQDVVERDYRWCTDLQPLLDYVAERKAKKLRTILGLDTESSSFGHSDFPHWYIKETKILTVQISARAGQSFVVPLWYPGFPVSKIRRNLLISQLKRLLEDPWVSCCGQNLKHDWMQLFAKLGITIKIEDDTLLLAHMLNENMLSKNLEEIARLYIPEVAGHKDAFTRKGYDKSRMDLVPAEDILEYSGADSDVVLRLRKVLLPKIQADKKLYNCYRRVVMPAIRAFCDIERAGFKINRTALEALRVKMEKHQEAERKFILSKIPRSIIDKHKDTGVGIKLTRPVILEDWLFTHPDGYKFKPLQFTKTGKIKISSKTHLPYFLNRNKVIGRLIAYIKNDTMLNSFIGRDTHVDPTTGKEVEATGFWKYIFDEYVRPSYLLHGTVTGRSSCVHEDTLIRTARGRIAIRDVVIGDLVWTHKGRWRRVTATQIKPVETMYNVSFSNGQNLLCTAGHGILTDTGWKALSDVILESYGKRRPDGCSRLHEIQNDELNDGANRGGASHRSQQYSRDNQTKHLEGRDTRLKARKVPRQQDWFAKSYAGPSSGEFHRGLRRRIRLLNESGGWGSLLCAPDCDGGITGATPVTATGASTGAPHRPGHEEQRAGQSRVNHESGSCSDAPPVCIKSITPDKEYSVYDITVEEDQSYEAAGILNHNSRDPNGQNFPKRGEFAKEYRAVFEAPEGYVLIEADYSQMELRIAGILAREPTFLKIYREGGDIHCSTAAICMGISLDAFMKLKTDDPETFAMMRYRAKAVNFGFIYGMGWRKFVMYAKTEYGIDYTDEEARNIRSAFFDKYSNIEHWHTATKAFAREHKYVRALDGRIRHLPAVVADDDGVASSAERQAVNSPVQGFGSDLGLIALSRINSELPYSTVRVVGFVHDALICIAPIGKEMEAARLVKQYMESNPLEEWFGFKSPIPLLAEVSIGMNLAKMIEVKDKWLNDPTVDSYEKVKALNDAGKAPVQPKFRMLPLPGRSGLRRVATPLKRAA